MTLVVKEIFAGEIYEWTHVVSITRIDDTMRVVQLIDGELHETEFGLAHVEVLSLRA